ncbi:hypothetical protein TWF481_005999 [Arthrobotrys musiformis]|uniref:Uncharacterized protein n=1 Tax=Arthrobotrys musiformis TaxID=47236 RepID=A0AAV9WFF7_9PEZI
MTLARLRVTSDRWVDGWNWELFSAYLNGGADDGVATDARTESAGSDRRGDLEEALEDPSIAGSSLGSSWDD